ncbi:hypothetical protein L3X38_022012 [Prunus dulcis]|uniref:Uncharacterized protein n=1 Tax=Prunus dulcis TaxID=3755 RepID=A0AAD4VW55_PRUDU|nr:hypothetical protein L3X38_022012 [Prunus dulcis]
MANQQLKAIDHGFIIGPGFDLPAHFSPIYFPMGNAATGFFVTFALIAEFVGAGFSHFRNQPYSILDS